MIKNNKNEKEQVIGRLKGLLNAGRIVTSSLDSTQVMKSIIELARDMLQAEVASILLVDEKSKELVFEFSTDLDPNQEHSIRVPLGQGIAGYVAQTGQTLNIQDVKQDPRFYTRVDQKTGFETRSHLCVPLKIKDKIIGTAQVLNKIDAGAFTSSDQELLEGFAVQAAIAIQNARLFEDLQQARDLLGEENIHLKREVLKRYQFGNIIGTSKPMQAVYSLIEKVMDTPTTILIQGETGTGKELIARTLHYNSRRKNGKFIAIDCGAIPEQLLESELFGYKRGAFTGAVNDKKGLFEAANGGTIFLDEIGDISPMLQQELLRVLQQNEIRRVGENIFRKIDVRVVSATHRNLKHEIQQGRFREDLYYRLKVIIIELPALRDRKEDIPAMVKHFIKKYNRRIKKKVDGFTLEAMNLLQNYDWPGNVRELEHEIERAVTLADAGQKIMPELLSDEIRHFTISTALHLQNKGTNLKDLVSQFERSIIREQLKRYDGNVTKSAQLLGITRQGLFKKITKYKIKRE